MKVNDLIRILNGYDKNLRVFIGLDGINFELDSMDIHKVKLPDIIIPIPIKRTEEVVWIGD